MSFKKSQVVMLSTNEKAIENEDLVLFNNNQLKINNNFCALLPSLNPLKCNLYFLSDEEIKEGDWYINNGVIFRADDKFDEGNNPNQNKNNKKIISTTDKSLGNVFKVNHGLSNTTGFEPLPQPSESFIKAYIKAYNEGKPITEVLIEYEFVAKDFTVKSFHEYHKENKGIEYLKVNPKDNTITIRKVKDSFNLQELENFLVKHYLDIASKNGCNLGENVRTWTKKWIEENL